MIDIEKEQLRLLTKASADVPGNPHISTLIRWALRGLKGIKLETALVGGRRFTSVEAIQRFLVRLNEPGTVASSSASKKRQQEIACVERRLDDEGIS
jgi:hypothetical protein